LTNLKSGSDASEDVNDEDAHVITQFFYAFCSCNSFYFTVTLNPLSSLTLPVGRQPVKSLALAILKDSPLEAFGESGLTWSKLRKNMAVKQLKSAQRDANTARWL